MIYICLNKRMLNDSKGQEDRGATSRDQVIVSINPDRYTQLFTHRKIHKLTQKKYLGERDTFTHDKE